MPESQLKIASSVAEVELGYIIHTDSLWNIPISNISTSLIYKCTFSVDDAFSNIHP